MKKLVIVLAVIIVILIAVLFFVSPSKKPATSSQPPVVAAPLVSSDGHLAVNVPALNQLVTSPFQAEGTVMNGGWFFEATFPVKVVDADGTVLGTGQAKAQGDWMTTDPVPFTAALTFSAPHSATGTIVFSKDNPSGDPKNDLSLSIPVRFK